MSKENRVSDERLRAMLSAEIPLGMSVADARSIIEELLALRSKPVAGVEVEPLEWDDDGDWQGGECAADSEVGQYFICASIDTDKLRLLLNYQADGSVYQTQLADGLTHRQAREFANTHRAETILSALLPKATAPVVSEPVAKPYAFEFGKSNGDGTYCVVIERVGEGYVERFAVKDWPIKPLYASTQPEAVITEEMVERAYDAFVAACEWSDWDEPEVRGYVRAALEAALKEA